MLVKMVDAGLTTYVSKFAIGLGRSENFSSAEWLIPPDTGHLKDGSVPVGIFPIQAQALHN